jgi:hypothetical protein
LFSEIVIHKVSEKKNRIKKCSLFSGQNQSSVRELKNENHFLKDYIHRLNAASSEYQTIHPPKTLKKEMNVGKIFHLVKSIGR